MPVDARPTVAAPDDDPYLWLEEVEGARALAWVEAENSVTLEKFGNATFASDRDALATLLDRPDHIPFVVRRGRHLYNYWKDASNPRGLWRRTTLDSFRTDQPAWEVLLDVDALAAKEKEDWIWQGASTLPGTHDRAILSLSRGGSDAAVLREFDIGAKAFVSDGFYLPEAKGGTDWLDRDTLVLSSAYGKDMATKSGYSRTVRLWRRGSNVDEAPVLIETTPESMGLWASVDRTRDTETIWFADKPGFFDTIFWLGDRSGPKVKLDLPTDIAVESHGEWLVVKRRTEWTVGGKTYAPDTLLGISLPAFLAGARDFTVLFQPGERRAIQGFFWSNGPLVLSILDELKPVFEVLTPSPRSWSRSKLSGLPEIGVVNVWRFDMYEAESNGDLLGNAQDPHHPGDHDADRARQGACRAETGAQHLQRRRARRDAARGDCRRRRAHPLRAGRPDRRDRRRAGAHDAATAVSVSRGCPTTAPPSASSGWSGAAPASPPTSGAAASSARAGTMPGAWRASRSRMTTSRRWRAISSSAGSLAPNASRRRAAPTAASSSPTC